MLGKLLKYDLKWSLKLICIFLGIGLFLAILGRVLELCPDSMFFTILIGIIKGASLSLTITGVFNAVIRSWVRFILNCYKDESYLTNTIPVKRSTILLAKSLNALILITLSIVMLFINLVIMYYSQETLDAIKESLNIFSNAMDISVVGLIISFVVVILLEVLFLTQAGFFGIVFGYSYNKNKLALSLVFGIVSYVICSTFSVVALICMSLFDEGLRGIILGGTGVIDFTLLKVLIAFAMIIYLVYIVVLYFITNKKYTKGINID